jgi:hypothetical protein|tara:strand:+ start:888 stop:1247 length:360 start_codon:yes stop_codon:yes gene_type:complete
LQNVADIAIKVGKVPSLNDFYGGKHYYFRSSAKNKFKGEILIELDKHDKITFKKVTVVAKVNYGYDVDNCIMAIKFAMDALREWGGIPDDTKKYFPKLTIQYDPEQEKNTSTIIFSGEL